MAQYDPFEEFEESFRAALDFLTGQSRRRRDPQHPDLRRGRGGER